MFPVDAATTIPKTLKNLHPHPETPWLISSSLFTRLSQPSSAVIDAPYKKCELLPTNPESDFVKAYFLHQKPTYYTISKIFCLHNPSLLEKFRAGIEVIDLQAKTLKPEWNKEEGKEEREKVIARWKEQASLFFPISIPRDSRKDIFFNVRVLPLWHATSAAVCHAIATYGFIYSGKHHFFNSNAKAGTFKSTDPGYFGSGIYFTNSAKYASLYDSGQLLMALVSMKEPFPVINNVPHPQQGEDMIMLGNGNGAYQTYNAHYIPVAPLSDSPGCMQYYPCYKNQAPVCDELVVFQNDQTLPRFLVELTPDFFPNSPTLTTPIPSTSSSTTTATSSPPTTTASTSSSSSVSSTTKSSPSSTKKPSSSTQEETEELNLCSACIVGDFPFVKKEVESWYIRKEKRINKPNSEGYTPLILAIQNQHFDIVQFVLNNKADFLFVDSQGYQPLHWACKTGNIKIVQLLAKSGAPINVSGLYQRTPLHMAAHNGHAPVVAWLISVGASINAQTDQNDNFTTPLHEAVMREHLGVVQTLCGDSNLNVNLTDLNQHTPLYYAVVTGQLEVVQLITRHLSWERPNHHSHPNHPSQLLKLSPAKNGSAIQAYLQTLEKSSYSPEKKQ